MVGGKSEPPSDCYLTNGCGSGPVSPTLNRCDAEEVTVNLNASHRHSCVANHFYYNNSELGI